MTTSTVISMAPTEFELSITRLIDAPRERIFEAWTNPAMMVKWFAPAPITLAECEVDPRTGGVFRILMRAEDGTEYPSTGIYLDVVAPERIITTDAYSPGWVPAAKPFMTTIITIEEEAGKSRYTARVRHWNAEDRDQHEQMGFEAGWGQCLDQLEALVTQGAD